MSESGIVVDVNPTLGALEIGVLCTTFLFGLVTVQTFSYYRKFPSDSSWTKLMVGLLWSLELGHTLAISHGLYRATISLYGQPKKLIHFDSLITTVVFGALVTFVVQIFFSYRLYRMLSHSHVAVLCAILSFVRLIGGAVAAVMGFKLTLASFLKQWNWLLTTLLVLSSLTDVIIATSMCLYLHRRRLTAPKRTAKLLDGLIKWTIQTGLLTSIAAVAMIIVFHVMSNFVWMAIYAIVAKLYSSSLLASLNSRTKLRTHRSNDFDLEIPDAGSNKPISFPQRVVLDRFNRPKEKYRHTSWGESVLGSVHSVHKENGQVDVQDGLKIDVIVEVKESLV